MSDDVQRTPESSKDLWSLMEEYGRMVVQDETIPDRPDERGSPFEQRAARWMKTFVGATFAIQKTLGKRAARKFMKSFANILLIQMVLADREDVDDPDGPHKLLERAIRGYADTLAPVSELPEVKRRSR